MTHEVLADTIFVIFEELAKFNKEPEECLTKQDQMLYILKNSGTFTEIYRPLWNNFDALESILEKMKIAGFDEIKRMQYEKDMYDERRRNGEIAAAQEEGMNKERIRIAEKMLDAGMPIDQIAQITDLTSEEIEALR